MSRGIQSSLKSIITILVVFGLVLSSFGNIKPASANFAQDIVKAANGETHVIFDYNTLRGADQIIVYTPEYGSTTPNNRWGTEVVVKDNIVTELRDGPVDATEKAPIPENGYVISGHGTARTWILANISMGDNVELLYGVITAPIKTSTFTAEKINPESPFAYPGGRGTNELIVYTQDFENDSTGTNQYGAEIIVRNGIVVEMGGSNSVIPEDGMVLSGHGSAQKWLLENTQVGASISVDFETKEVTSTIDASAYIRAAELVLEESKKRIALAEEQYLDVPLEAAKQSLKEVEQALSQARTAFEAEKWQETIDQSEKATLLAKQAAFQTVESRVVDARGVWHRPTENNREEIIRTLDKLEEANFNILFLETFFHGYTIYPSDFAEQNPDFEGWNPLQVFIEEGKKRGIEVHSWVHTFFVGHESLNPPGPILSENPEWAAVDREGGIPSVREQGYYFMNPALPAVRDFLSTLFNEMVTEYEIDGLHLDYIRYPVSLPIQNGFSYDEYSRAEFKKEFGVDPLDITPEDTELWNEWNVWRQKQISTFVERIHGEVKSVDRNIDVSTAVFPEVSDAIDQKFQNWVEWVSEGYMDFITPMIYAVDTKYVQRTTENFMSRFEQPVLAYIGLAPFIGFSDDLLVDQVTAINETSAGGQVQFALHSLKDEHFAALKLGPQRKEAFLPHADPIHASNLVIAEMERKIDEIYVPKGGLQDQVVIPLEKHFKNIQRQLNNGELVSAKEIVKEAKALIEGRTKHIDEAVIAHLIKDLNQVDGLIDFAIFKKK